MAIFNKGISSNTSLPPGDGFSTRDLGKVLGKLKTSFQVGRVTDIILNKDYPNIEEYGGDSAIGTIFYETEGFIGSNDNTAKPFSSQMSSYPLVDELVLLFYLPTKNIGNNPSEKGYYYINVISLWGSPHHNAYPNPLKNKDIPLSQKKTYQQVENGSPKKITSQNLELDFNSPYNPSQATFIERNNIHPLLPFAGDVMYQGRWGNSIRLGSTVQNGLPDKRNFNNWSNVGTNGDPITIFLNGQDPNNTKPGYEYCTEDINEDMSSIYMTSTQSIPFIVSNKNYKSYLKEDTPILPLIFNNSPQILLNSGRLVLNSKTDHLLLSSQKSIFLGANSTVNVSSKGMVVDSLDIKLGSKDATEPMILGNKFLGNLEAILTELSNLCRVIGQIQEVSWVNPETGEPKKIKAVNGQLKIISDNLSDMIAGSSNSFISEMDSYKSKVNKIL